MEIICGKCFFPIEKYETMRHFRTSVAHPESRCIELLRMEIERLKKKVEAEDETL